MRAVALATLAALLLAGCSGESRSSSDRTCVNGVCTEDSREMECRGDDCEVCVDGECAPCERDDCATCVDGGACPEGLVKHAPDAGNATFEDVQHQRTYDLTQGLPKMSWSFDTAAGATGHIRIVLRDPVTKDAVVMGGACFEYDVATWDADSYQRQQGSQGSCSDGSVGNVGGTTTSSAMTLADWSVGRRGHYAFSVEAPPQANELVVDIAVDNP